MSETGEDPQAVASVTIAKGFLIAGGKLKNVTTSAGADYQTEAFIGVAGTLGGIDLELTATHKIKQGASGDNGYVEYGFEASRAFGAYTLSTEFEFTPDNAGARRQSWWSMTTLSRKLTDAWSVSAGVGGRRQAPADDYTAWNIGTAYKLAPKTRLDLRLHDTDSDAGGRDARVVAAIRQTF